MHTPDHDPGFFSRYFTQSIPATVMAAGNIGTAYIASDLAGYDRELVRQVAERAKNLDPRLRTDAYDGTRGGGAPFKDAFRGNIPKYDPKTHTAHYAKDSTGFAAHELGHSQQYKNRNYRKYIMPITQASRIASTVGMLPASLIGFFADDESTINTVQNLSLLAMAPMMAEELDASARGANLIRKTKRYKQMSRLKRLAALARPFSGIPNYLFQYLTPYAMMEFSKRMNQYKKDEPIG